MDKKNLNKIAKHNGRVLRNRQYKQHFQNNRPTKRLFTPEIKRHLKSWLVRRRENPYPNKDEKLALAEETGLTYIQICNWFANWRRKLKNSGKHINISTWSALIKEYNGQAFGNVEHLSISSDDSIWEEHDFERPDPYDMRQISAEGLSEDHCYSCEQECVQNACDLKLSSEQNGESNKNECIPQCFQISSTTDFVTVPEKTVRNLKGRNLSKKSYARHDKKLVNSLDDKLTSSMCDKNWNYRKLKGKSKSKSDHILFSDECQAETDAVLLSKWRKSIALFQPNCKTYSRTDGPRKKRGNIHKKFYKFHGREELDAAEALTFLAMASTYKL